MASTSKAGAPTIQLMDHETDMYFRRLTWVASKIHDQYTPIGSDREYDPSSEISSSSESGAIGRDRTLSVLQSISNLLTRHAKVVAVVSGGSKLSVMEEPQKGNQDDLMPPSADLKACVASNSATASTTRKANSKGKGRIVVSRNPRWSVDRFGEGSGRGSDFTWFDHLGIRTVEVAPNSNFRTPISPNRPFADHLQTLLSLVDAKGITKGDFKPMLEAQVYVIRTCFLKIASRASYHCPVMQPRHEEVTRGKGGKGKFGKEKGLASASTIQSTAPKVKGFDYGAVLLPTKTRTSEKPLELIRNLFKAEERWKNTQTLSVSKLLDTAVPMDGSIADRELDVDITSINCVQALEFATESFDTLKPGDIITFGQLHAAFGAILLCFFSGIKTLGKISTVPSQEDAWNNFANQDSKDLREEIWDPLCTIVLSGGYLNSLVRAPDVDPVFSRYLHVLFDPEHAKGCLKWLQTTTEHYSSLKDLRRADIQAKLSRIQVSLIEVRFSKDHQDDSIMDLDKFFDKVPGIHRNDRVRLANEIKATQGNHAGLMHFNGTMHAETILLILILMTRTEKYKGLVPARLSSTIKSINPTILGVSKRCCPVCSAVINIVETKLEIVISHSGSHSTYSACCLPPWTPLEIALEIIGKVEREVVKVLEDRAMELRRSLRTTRGSGTPQPLDRVALPEEADMPYSATKSARRR